MLYFVTALPTIRDFAMQLFIGQIFMQKVHIRIRLTTEDQIMVVEHIRCWSKIDFVTIQR